MTEDDDSSPFSGVELPDGPTEESTERDGVLSYAGEWHALVLGATVGLTGSAVFIGLFVGFVFGVMGGQLRETGHLRDAAREQAYSCFGLVVGFLLNVLFLGGSVLAKAGISVG